MNRATREAASSLQRMRFDKCCILSTSHATVAGPFEGGDGKGGHRLDGIRRAAAAACRTFMVEAAGPDFEIDSSFRGSLADGVALVEPQGSGLGVGLVGEKT